MFHRSTTLLSFIALICLHPLRAAAPVSFPEREAEADRVVRELLPKMTLEEKVLQTYAHSPNGIPRLGIPHLRSGETLHGAVAAGCTSFPQSIALGATFDPVLLEEIATVIAREARAVGIAQTFGPMLAISRDPRWGRVEESYGEDPFLVTRFGVAYINGMQGRGDARFGPDSVITTPKHFAADGEPWAGANGEGFETSERNLRENHLRPFEAAVKEAGTMSIMPAHHALNGVPCHMNSWLLQTLLRGEWGFQGFVTSDMGDITKIGVGGGYGGYRVVKDDEASVIAAIKAGVDVELAGKHNQKLVKAVRDGKISEQVIDRAAARVLRAKVLVLGLGAPAKPGDAAGQKPDATGDAIKNYKGADDVWAKLIADGQFDTPGSSKRPDWLAIVNDPKADALALKAAQKAIVLLKNDPAILPLDRSKVRNILVTGPLASQVNLGGYSTGKPKFFTTVVDGFRKAVEGTPVEVDYAQGCRRLEGKQRPSQHPVETFSGTEPDEAKLLEEAQEKAKSADVIIAVVGHGRTQLGENLDRDTLDLPGAQQALVEAMQATGKPVVVVLNSGNVHSIGWIKEHVPAIVQAFYLGQSSGTAIAQCLLGDINPGGKLPISFPRNVGQSPWYYNHPPLTGPVNYHGKDNDPKQFGGPLFSFGHGLSYTTFAYSDLRAAGPITRTEPGSVTVTVTNTGAREGDEVVQLYIRQDLTSLVRPVMELKGFQRITLKPGEKREVTFPLGFEEVKFWKDGQWVAEPGTVQVMAGSSSADIRLKGTLEIEETAGGGANVGRFWDAAPAGQDRIVIKTQGGAGACLGLGDVAPLEQKSVPFRPADEQTAACLTASDSTTPLSASLNWPGKGRRANY